MLSFRFGPSDGVSVEARKWAWALEQLGFAVRWIAGDGDALDARVPGLAIGATAPPSRDDIERAIDDADVVIVENLLSLPLNPHALTVVAATLRGRPAVVHHHDLPWQRPQFATFPAPPDHEAWVHVTINDLSRLELAAHGIDATTLHNRFARPERTGAAPPNLDPRAPVLLHPTRAIPRKNVPAAVRLAEAIGATYWLLGPAEDGYADELERILAAARCPVVRGGGASIGDAYAACDAVVYPSTWEGFGNPTIESALARKPLAVGSYPVLDELRSFGFRWFSVDDVDPLRAVVDEPDVALLDHNESIAVEHFSIDRLPGELAAVLERVL